MTAVAGELGNELFIAAQEVGTALGSVVKEIADTQGIFHEELISYKKAKCHNNIYYNYIYRTAAIKRNTRHEIITQCMCYEQNRNKKACACLYSLILSLLTSYY